jgi:hypothetical protein
MRVEIGMKINKVCLALAMLTVMVSVGAYSQSPKHAPDFTLTLSTAKETMPALRSGERLTIDVEEKNISQHPVNLGRNKADLPYQMSVLRNGLPAETTEEYRRITNPNPTRTPNADPGVMLFMLDPGESQHFQIVLTDYFDLSQPGYYEITFSRGTDKAMADNVEVKSNTLTIHVVPRDDPPPAKQ